MVIRVGGDFRTSRPRSVIRKRPRDGLSSSPACFKYETDQLTRFEKVAWVPDGSNCSVSSAVSRNSELSTSVASRVECSTPSPA